MAIEDYYNQTVKKITVSTGAWGTTGSRTTAAVFLAAVNLAGKELYADDKRTVFYDAKFYCPASVCLSYGDKLSIDNSDYNIISIKNTLNKGHHQKVLLKRQA